MSSLALYRRYRPETFAEVIGQEHVTDPLQQALRNNRVNHAYLFSGPRGCGKTTSARILARCLNCEEGPTPTPCGTCQSCVDLARNGRGSIDVIEIDAASHGGVDDARELREKAFFGPASSRYKIYIIDEAHMVTSAGFNALLKVVEEPPEHLKFIFATTEPEKVIGTIRSRTHHYPFRLVPPGTLRDYLAEVCGREDIPVEDGVLPLVVRAGAGSVRDSMSVMDQLLAGAGADGVTYAMATSLLGYTDGSLLDAVVEAFAAGDGAAAFEVVDRVIEGGNDPRRFVADLLERLRDLVILAAVPDAGEKGLIDAPADVVERMTAQASVFGAAELSRAADLVNAGLTEMRGATSPRLQLELICARVLLPAAYDDERSVQARLDRLERGIGAGGAAMALGGGPGPAGGVGPAGAVMESGGPSVAYAPGAEAHPPMPASGPSGPAAARAAVRGTTGAAPSPGPGAGAEAGAGGSAGPGPSAPAAPAAPVAPAGSGGAEAPAGPADASQGGAARPGAWPGGTRGPGAAGAGQGAAARQPGSWPSAVAPGQGGPAGQTGQAGQAGQAAQAGQSGSGGPGGSAGQSGAGAPAASGAGPAGAAGGAPASGAGGAAGSGQAGAGAAAQGAAQVRQLWPQILDAVKGRRRFTWILLSQNAQVSGFDGTTLQIGFPNAGARDSFANGGSEDVLKEVLAENFQLPWRVEAIVDPSGGASPPAGGARGGGGGFGGGASGGYGGGSGAPQQSAPQAPARQSAPAPEQGPGGGSGQGARMAREAVASSPSTGGGQGGPAAEPSYTAPESSMSIEYDMPAEDDPDLVDSALSGHELIVRELGATVLEEFDNE
ncbi:DNA polymerase III subunit gamma and tau [Streptomyces sp. S186]|uniref:DNA polymerase III subunit gamma and tau n=1 Tax=Streptomyces sp. S186 TaxID=3434395 RepID=UPI003F670842